MVVITIVTGAYKQTYNWGASHCINVNLLQWLNKTYVSPRFTRHRCWSNTFQAQTPALRPNVPQRRSKAWLGRPGKRRWNGVETRKNPGFTIECTRSWGFGIFRVYWVSKSKCIISRNLRAEGSWGKVLNVVIFVESVVHRSNWRSRETETVGNSRKQSETAGNSRERPGVIMPKLSIRHFFAKKNFPRNPIFWLKVQRETVGNSWGSYFWLGKKRAI